MARQILMGRFLTRSGDQAWDFAVPLVLLKLFPGELRIAALYYLLSKAINVALLPRMARLIDHLNRLSSAKLGIVLQLIGVFLGAAAIYALHGISREGMNWFTLAPAFTFCVLVAGGVLSSLGSVFMDIAIANDLVPTLIESEDLSKFNSRLRQLDLFTEVTSPIAAGLLLLIDTPALFGFYLIALWNLISFFPELRLLKSILRRRPELLLKVARPSKQTSQSLLEKLAGGWRSFIKEPIALVATAYALLWLSVLSPHGVLLSGYLKDGWHLPEWAIGTFRGLGAVFGLLATVLFPWAERRWSLLAATRNFIVFQTSTLAIALVFFYAGGILGQIGFLSLILLSRIGLYGFSLGEMQIRQIGINPEVRGEVNGFANALTGIATLFLFGLGTLLPNTGDFSLLILLSVLFVVFGCIIYCVWLYSRQGHIIQSLATEHTLKDQVSSQD